MIKTRNKSIITLLILMVIITGFGRLSKLLEIKTAEASQLPQVKEENQILKNKLEASSKIETPEVIRKISRMYIKKYFGKDAEKVERVMTCESGLNIQAVNINKPGLGVDRGLYQLNDRWHKARFEKMYNVPFEIGAHDPDLSSKYAKFLYDNSKGLGPWVCARIASI